MIVFAATWAWVLGYVVGVVVVALVAVLVLSITALAKRITAQAEGITSALDGARANTDGLWDVRTTNSAADRITRGLKAARESLG